MPYIPYTPKTFTLNPKPYMPYIPYTPKTFTLDPKPYIPYIPCTPLYTPKTFKVQEGPQSFGEGAGLGAWNQACVGESAMQGMQELERLINLYMYMYKYIYINI